MLSYLLFTSKILILCVGINFGLKIRYVYCGGLVKPLNLH